MTLLPLGKPCSGGWKSCLVLILGPGPSQLPMAGGAKENPENYCYLSKAACLTALLKLIPRPTGKCSSYPSSTKLLSAADRIHYRKPQLVKTTENNWLWDTWPQLTSNTTPTPKLWEH